MPLRGGGLGVGGQDLSADVRGASTLAAMAALEVDRATEALIVLSKPPAAEVAEEVRAQAAVHDTPIVAAVIDVPGGWNKPKKYSLSLKNIGNWPTHKRFRDAKAGRVASNKKELCEVINLYLKNPSLDAAERRKFIEDEITFTDGTSGKRTAEFILKLLNSSQSPRERRER